MNNVGNKTVIVTGAGSNNDYYITKKLLHKDNVQLKIKNGIFRFLSYIIILESRYIIDLSITHSYNAIMTLQEKFGKGRVIFFSIDTTNMEVYSSNCRISKIILSNYLSSTIITFILYF